MVAQASEVMDAPTVSTPATSTGREPNRSMAQPIAGDSAMEDSAPALTAPAISVRDQPSSCDIG